MIAELIYNAYFATTRTAVLLLIFLGGAVYAAYLHIKENGIKI